MALFRRSHKTWPAIIFFIFVFSSVTNSADFYDLEAEDISFDYEKDRIYATGQVLFTSGEIIITAEEIVVEAGKNMVFASGDEVLLRTPEHEVSGEYLEYDYGHQTGSFYGAHSELDEIFFSGGIIEIIEGKDYHLQIKKAAFTPCVLPDPHYQIKAERVRIYPGDRVVGEGVGFWWGDSELIKLPSYIVTYEETDEGDLELTSTMPIPQLGYNSREGLTLEVNYPYEIGPRSRGRIYLKGTGEDTGGIEISNVYYIHQNLTLQSGYTYDKLIEKEKGDHILNAGLNYSNRGLQIETGVDYYLQQQERKEELEIELKSETDERITIFQQYRDENLEKHSYSFDSSSGFLDWQMQYRLGYDVDYRPYFTFGLPDFYNFKSGFELGRVSENEGEYLEKLKLNLQYSNSYTLTAGLSLDLGADYVSNFYYFPDNEHYRAVTFNTTLNWSEEVSENINFNGSLGYTGSATAGEYRLKDDRIKEVELLKAGLGITIATPQPQSAWKLKGAGDYRLSKGEWEEINLNIKREFDCYSLDWGYEVTEGIFSFAINLQ